MQQGNSADKTSHLLNSLRAERSPDLFQLLIQLGHFLCLGRKRILHIVNCPSLFHLLQNLNIILSKKKGEGRVISSVCVKNIEELVWTCGVIQVEEVRTVLEAS